MKTFSYHSPKDVKEASKLASSSSMFLAGGMTSIPSMKLGMATYKDVIDLKKIKKLSGIKVSSKTVTIGATTKHAEVASSKDVQKAIPALAKLAGNIGDAQVRNRGTIGGSISNNDPSACYPSACMALNAVIHTNERKIEANKFFKGMFETALKKGEIVEAVEFQIPEKADYQKHPNPASRYAIVGVFVAKHKDEVNVAVTGAKSCVYTDKDLDDLLSIVLKYVEDPDDAEKEIERFDTGGFDAMSDYVTANLLRDKDYNDWYNKLHSIKEEEMDDEDMDKAATSAAKQGASISKIASKLGETTSEMKSLVNKYKKAQEPEKSELMARLKELTKIKKELESLL